MAGEVYQLAKVQAALDLDYRKTIGIVQLFRRNALSFEKKFSRRVYSRREVFEIAIVKTLAYDLMIGPLHAYMFFRHVEDQLPIDDVLDGDRDAIALVPHTGKGARLTIYDGPTPELARDVFSRTSCLLLRLRDIWRTAWARIAEAA